MVKSAQVSACQARCQDCDFALQSSNGQALAAQHTLRYHHTVVWQITFDGVYRPDPIEDPDQLIFPPILKQIEEAAHDRHHAV